MSVTSSDANPGPFDAYRQLSMQSIDAHTERTEIDRQADLILFGEVTHANPDFMRRVLAASKQSTDPRAFMQGFMLVAGVIKTEYESRRQAETDAMFGEIIRQTALSTDHPAIEGEVEPA